MSNLTSAQYFTSRQIGSPVVNHENGSLLTMLDAVLVTGTCPSTASAVTIDGDFVKITLGVSQPYETRQFVTISGATSPQLNGSHRIIKTDATSIWVEKGDITVTSGTLKLKTTPLGWESMFGTNSPTKRAYRSLDPLSTKTVLYLDSEYEDRTGANASRPSQLVKVAACMDMTELGVQIRSLTAEKSSTVNHGFYHWIQSMGVTLTSAASTTDVPWVVVGDGRIFYLIINYNPTYHSSFGGAIYLFGDLPKLAQDDEFGCILSCSSFGWDSIKSTTYYGAEVSNMTGATLIRPEACPILFLRTQDGMSSMEDSNSYTIMSSNTAAPTSGRDGFSRLNPYKFGVITAPVYLARRTRLNFAGELPYLRYVASDISPLLDAQALHLVIADNQLLVLVSASKGGSGASNHSTIAIDLENPRVEDNLL